MRKPVISLAHSGGLGDIVTALPAMQSFGKFNLYLKLSNLMNKEMAESFITLLEIQPYINIVKIHKNERIDLDYDSFRTISNLVHTPLSVAHLCVYRRFYNLCQPWIFNVESKFINKIILNRTVRYHGREQYIELINLHKNEITFLGHKEEHEIFCNFFHFNIDFYKTKDILETSQIIAGSDIFVGNQSMCWNIAEALKIPRYLEICDEVPNVIPCGLDGHCSWEDKSMIEIIERYLK